MERIPVFSSNLRSVGYDHYTQTLEIEFRGGRLYAYYHVPESRYNGLMSAGSKGSYFHNYIKHAFSYRKLSRSLAMISWQ